MEILIQWEKVGATILVRMSNNCMNVTRRLHVVDICVTFWNVNKAAILKLTWSDRTCPQRPVVSGTSVVAPYYACHAPNTHRRTRYAAHATRHESRGAPRHASHSRNTSGTGYCGELPWVANRPIFTTYTRQRARGGLLSTPVFVSFSFANA